MFFVKFPQGFPALISHLMQMVRPQVLPGKDFPEIKGRLMGKWGRIDLHPHTHKGRVYLFTKG